MFFRHLSLLPTQLLVEAVKQEGRRKAFARVIFEHRGTGKYRFLCFCLLLSLFGAYRRAMSLAFVSFSFSPSFLGTGMGVVREHLDCFLGGYFISSFFLQLIPIATGRSAFSLLRSGCAGNRACEWNG